jgi:hypothetical protein
MPNKIAIMQPYVFPYIGYMNLVHASDNFVFYDDVNFIKGGWVNRNQIMLMGEPYRFAIPLKRQSQNLLIKDTEVSDLTKFAGGFLEQLRVSYKKSPYKDSVLDYVREVFKGRNVSISEVAIASVKLFFKYIGVNKAFHCSSIDFPLTRGLERAERLIKITELLQSTEYINPVGGAFLYEKEFFSSRGITLQFVKPSFIPYEHCNRVDPHFYPGLSIIDILMNLSEQDTRIQLESFELV